MVDVTAALGSVTDVTTRPAQFRGAAEVKSAWAPFALLSQTFPLLRMRETEPSVCGPERNLRKVPVCRLKRAFLRFVSPKNGPKCRPCALAPEMSYNVGLAGGGRGMRSTVRFPVSFVAWVIGSPFVASFVCAGAN